jgi:cobalt-zinc-cadmium efflux system outer membrane protein
MAAWQNLLLSVSEYQKIRNYYTDDFDLVFEGVNTNFQKRNISILEFVDFFESYNESLSEFERVKTFLANSAMQINYVTASKIF